MVPISSMYHSGRIGVQATLELCIAECSGHDKHAVVLYYAFLIVNRHERQYDCLNFPNSNTPEARLLSSTRPYSSDLFCT